MVGVGSTTITANNIGDDNYNSASDELVLTVLRATQSLFDAGADKNDIKTTDANFTQKPTGVLGNGATTYTTSNGESVVKINLSTGEVEVKGAGITTITVTNAGDDLYQSVSDQYQIIVLKVTQPSFDAGANHLDLTPTSANFTQSATGVLGDGVTTYKSSDTGVAQVDADGNITIITVPFTASTTITATNPGDDTYLPAIDTYQITITPDYFITTWKTTTDNEAIAIPARDDTYLYNYNVDWGDGNTDISLRDYESHTYATAGTYTVKISGTFPAFYSNNFEYSNKLLSIERWGKQKFVSMEKAFKGCENLVINATDTPDLSLLTPISTRTDEMFYGAKNLTSTTGNWAWDTSNVSTMKLMFYGATNFNQDITGWDVSKVTNMEAMFYEAHAFNQDIGNWDVSAVEYMIQMFRYATAFNGNIDNWGNKTANVTSMLAMFYEADAFNQDISGWDVSEVTDMSYMFYNTNAFNKDINSWAVSNVEDMESLEKTVNELKKQTEELPEEELTKEGGKYKVPCLRIENDTGDIKWLYESNSIISYLKTDLKLCPN